VDLSGRNLVACLAERPDVAKPNDEEFVATFLPVARSSRPAIPRPKPLSASSRRGSRGNRVAARWC
jgi:fructose-1-phosphate kinase PfkB-like protein